MARPRNSGELIELTGNARHLSRAELRERKAGQAQPPLTAAQLSELEQIDKLIQQILAECTRGSVLNKKKNPAFMCLDALTRVRERILSYRSPAAEPGDSVQEVLRTAAKLSGEVQ